MLLKKKSGFAKDLKIVRKHREFPAEDNDHRHSTNIFLRISENFLQNLWEDVHFTAALNFVQKSVIRFARQIE